jgi:hypothetical protein
MVYGLNVRPAWGFDPKVDWEGKGEPPRPIPALQPANDGGVAGDGYFAGLPVDGTNFPKWVKWSDPNGNPVPDFDQVPFLTVSEKAKRVIESLEPGVHQYFPVEYQDKQGNFTGIRYWFVPCNRIDSVDREHTNMVLLDGLQWTSPKNVMRMGQPLPPNVDPSKPAKFVFNVKAIGDRHIWRDKHIGGATCFISDAMGDLFKKEGLTGLNLDESRGEQV